MLCEEKDIRIEHIRWTTNVIDRHIYSYSGESGEPIDPDLIKELKEIIEEKDADRLVRFIAYYCIV